MLRVEVAETESVANPALLQSEETLAASLQLEAEFLMQ